jgi:hypothetical protein
VRFYYLQREPLVVAPYNAHVRRLLDALRAADLGDVPVGTVDKFQGREAPVVLYSGGPKGAVRFYYLQREPGTPFVVLPDLRQHRQLYWDTVRDWCQTLSLPVEDFGLPSGD